MIMRAIPRAVASANALQPSPDGTTFAPTWHNAISRSSRASAENRPSPRRAMSSRKTRSIGSSAQKSRVCSSVGLTNRTAAIRRGYRVRAMPIHVRAEPGDYAEAVLLPGDPLRAKYIADTYLDDVKQTNSERGMLGFRGSWEGKDVSVQSTGMGCPSAAIVIEELIMLGCTKLLRVGTCGGLQPHHKLGDMIIALTAVPQDGTVQTYVKEPHCPTADWGLVHGAVHAAKELGQPVHVGPIVSSDVFYNPDGGQYQRWSERGILGVEMEAAVLFTIGALKQVHAGCLLTVSDIVVEGEFTRISDEELRAAVDRMTRVALATVTEAVSGT
jgi:DeoD family purine-nucleoside phosphorylase